MFNAAVNYEKEKQIEKSNKALLLIVNDQREGDLKRRALFQIARNLTSLATYSGASKAYEYYAKKYPNDKRALEALQDAAFFRQGLGQLDKAIKNYKAYMKLVGRKDPQKASEVFFSIGKIFREKKEWKRVIKHYKKFLRKYRKVAKPDLIIEAYTRIGSAYWAQAQPYFKRKRKMWKNFDYLNGLAQRAYKSAYKTFKSLSDEQRSKLSSGIAAVAEARFRMGESIYIKIKYRTRLRPRFYRNVKKFMTAMLKEISKRGEIIASARSIYDEVILMKSPNWAIAALARQGEMLEATSSAIYNYPAPPKFTEDQKESFKGILTDRSEVYRVQAIDAYVLCMKKAQELRWFNEWSDDAERRLSILDPAKYRYNAEQRAKPTVFGPATIPQPFISALEEAAK
jgi:tetratricopeptide (TPR) repeat protein